jgi:hypothetical protein
MLPPVANPQNGATQTKPKAHWKVMIGGIDGRSLKNLSAIVEPAVSDTGHFIPLVEFD